MDANAIGVGIGGANGGGGATSDALLHNSSHLVINAYAYDSDAGGNSGYASDSRSMRSDGGGNPVAGSGVGTGTGPAAGTVGGASNANNGSGSGSGGGARGSVNGSTLDVAANGGLKQMSIIKEDSANKTTQQFVIMNVQTTGNEIGRSRLDSISSTGSARTGNANNDNSRGKGTATLGVTPIETSKNSNQRVVGGVGMTSVNTNTPGDHDHDHEMTAHDKLKPINLTLVSIVSRFVVLSLLISLSSLFVLGIIFLIIVDENLFWVSYLFISIDCVVNVCCVFLYFPFCNLFYVFVCKKLSLVMEKYVIKDKIYEET